MVFGQDIAEQLSRSYYNQGLDMAQIRDLSGAVDKLRISLQFNKNNIQARNLLGLVYYETYGKIELTEKGADLAKKILEAYDISYVFFKDVLGIDEEASKREAEKLKLTMEDNTINNLAKYVHKVLNLSDLNCDYDISKERCRMCQRRTKKSKVEVQK